MTYGVTGQYLPGGGLPFSPFSYHHPPYLGVLAYATHKDLTPESWCSILLAWLPVIVKR
jgi:hypothetical protein